MEIKKVFYLLFSTSILMACMKDEIPIPATPHVPGESQVNTVEMTQNYKYQVYFSLENNSVVSSNEKNIWDLGFEAKDDGWHIILNSSKSMFAAKTNKLMSDEIKDTLGNYKWKLDAATGNLDSTAIGDWRLGDNVFLVDRGYDEKGRHQGITKVVFQDVNSIQFRIRYADISENNYKEFTVNKDDQVNFVSFSFENGVVEVEPPKETWDLVFTQYTYVFEEDGNLPYVVTGALINRYKTESVRDTLNDFESITIESIQDLNFKTLLNVPGYNWKTFNFSSSSYEVHTDMNYVIKTQNNLYYKLRFIDFYNDMGQTGYPKFEFQRL